VKENADPVGYRFPSPFAGEMNQELEAFEQSVGVIIAWLAIISTYLPNFR
jgi:hypothetical protein